MSECVIPVIYGSVRTDRQGIKAARWIVKELQRRNMRPVLVDPLEYAFPLLDRMYKEFPAGTAPALMESLAQIFRSADGFVVVSGEYNHGIPPALKNLMDHYLEEYFWRPAAIVTYSSTRWGGVRAGVQLRSTLGEMGLVTIPSMQPIALVQDAFAEDGTPTDPKLADYSKKFFAEFEWYINALKTQRQSGVPY